MFTIFEEENEPLSERAKVDELLTKVQNTALAAAVAQLRFQLNTEGVTFTVAANHLNSAVSQTQDYQVARKISSTNTNERQQGGRGGRGNGRFNNRGGRGGNGRGRGGCGGRGSSGERGGKSGFNTNYYSPAEWNKSVIRKASKGVPSDPSVIFQLSNSLQLSARLKVIKLRLLLPILLTRILPAVMLEMPLAEKREQSEPSPLD
jgi:hypothetical protein